MLKIEEIRALVSVVRGDLPVQRTGQYPTSYPPGIDRNEAFYWVLGSFREEIMESVGKAPEGLKNVD